MICRSIYLRSNSQSIFIKNVIRITSGGMMLGNTRSVFIYDPSQLDEASSIWAAGVKESLKMISY